MTHHLSAELWQEGTSSSTSHTPQPPVGSGKAASAETLSLAPAASLLLLLRTSFGEPLPQISLQSPALRHLFGFSWPHLALGSSAPCSWSSPAVTPHHLSVSPPWGLIPACGAPVLLKAATAPVLGGPSQVRYLTVLDSERG